MGLISGASKTSFSKNSFSVKLFEEEGVGTEEKSVSKNYFSKKIRRGMRTEENRFKKFPLSGLRYECSLIDRERESLSTITMPRVQSSNRFVFESTETLVSRALGNCKGI